MLKHAIFLVIIVHSQDAQKRYFAFFLHSSCFHSSPFGADIVYNTYFLYVVQHRYLYTLTKLSSLVYTSDFVGSTPHCARKEKEKLKLAWSNRMLYVLLLYIFTDFLQRFHANDCIRNLQLLLTNTII